MNKKSAMAIVITIIVFVILIWLVLFIGGKNPENVEKTTTEQFSAQEQVVQNENVNDRYYLIMTDDQVKIYYANDMSFYDYADININQLPDDIKTCLINGMFINNEEQLYEFLESYSS